MRGSHVPALLLGEPRRQEPGLTAPEPGRNVINTLLCWGFAGAFRRVSAAGLVTGAGSSGRPTLASGSGMGVSRGFECYRLVTTSINMSGDFSGS